MSLDMGVVASGAELSRATVVALLGRIFGDDDRDLTEGVAKGEFAELVWDGERAATQWFVHAGATGVGELLVSVSDTRPARPVGVYRAEVARVVLLLRDLAQATGGRFVVEEADLTGTPLAVVLDLVAPGPSGPHGTAVFEDPPVESDEDYLRRYLDTGAERLAWLRGRATRTGGPRDLDFSRAGLGPLWEWAVGSLHLRPDDTVQERITLENGSVLRRPRNAVLPIWYGRTASLAPYNWSDESLAMLDAVAYYLAECVRQAVPGTSWRVGHRAGRGYPYEGQPVLAGPGEEFEPITDVLMWLTGKVYYLRRPHPDKPSDPPAGADLVERFDLAVQRIRG